MPQYLFAHLKSDSFLFKISSNKQIKDHFIGPKWIQEHVEHVLAQNMNITTILNTLEPVLFYFDVDYFTDTQKAYCKQI